MRSIYVFIAALAIVTTACSGEGSTGGGNGDDDGQQPGSDLADPCSLVEESTIESYFDEAVEPEPGGSGSFVTCSWSDSNANSLTVSVAVSDSVNRPETCPDCIDLDFGDDGYATSVPLQSTAEFVVGDSWYAVTTTGLGDDVVSIAALAQQVFEQVP
jgi:hypothetical protein